MARITRQALTSIGGFVIIALIAAALIIGGVLFVKNRAEQARRAEAVKIAQQQAEDQAADHASQVAADDATRDNGDAENTETANPDETSETNTPPVQTASELPVTGSENGLIQLVAVSVLAISSSLYIASRKAVRDTL